MFSEFNRYLLIFSKNKQKYFLTVSHLFFKLKSSMFIQNSKTLNVFGKFLLTLYCEIRLFEITRTIFSNSESSEHFFAAECFFNLFLQVS